MKPMFKMLLSSAAVATIAVAGLADSASAGRRVPAFAGIAQQPSQAGCLSNSLGVITNNCSGFVGFCIGLPYDYNVFGNWADMTVTVFQPGSATLSCQAVTTFKDGGFAGWSTNINADRTGTFTDIALHGGGIPDQGGVYTCCSLPPGGRMAVVNY